MSKTIRYVECAHCGETVGTYYVTSAPTAATGWLRASRLAWIRCMA